VAPSEASSGPPRPAGRPRPPSAATAETLVLVALILQAIGGVILLGVLAWALGFSVLYPIPLPLPIAWVGVGLTVGVGAVVVVFLYFAYHLAYVRIRQNEYVAAQTPCLVFGVLSLAAGILPGIFYLIAYVKLGDAVREQFSSVPSSWFTHPQAAIPDRLTCRQCGHDGPLAEFVTCPQCGVRQFP
jgi:hypothetical protein